MTRRGIPDLDKWQSSPEYQTLANSLSLDKFLEVTNLLLEKPNLNSSHLFRADILSDSAHILKTNAEKESAYGKASVSASTDSTRENNGENDDDDDDDDDDDKPITLPTTPALDSATPLTLERTIVRRLIPRNPQLDKPLTQTCHIYTHKEGESSRKVVVVVYLPHAADEADIPWYHPPIQALAYIYEKGRGNGQANDQASLGIRLSLRYLAFSKPTAATDSGDGGEATRLHRTFLSLLKTFIRLAKSPSSPSSTKPDEQSMSSSSSSSSSSLASQLKDTILPQHVVQNTYSTLKAKYAVDLISRWVEKTEPSKHVFEDLLIAAFLIELWKTMYGSGDGGHGPFTGFVDIACGNGILVYILLREGYRGFGLDARRRKTWAILGIDEHLHEQVIVPKPFLDVLGDDDMPSADSVHNGVFPPGTFIISNHADELTVWTPILAALASPPSPLPFLAIPCCSHALSGAKHRYPGPKVAAAATAAAAAENPQSGDLRALRAEHAAAAAHNDDKSAYACLTRKVAAIAAECAGGGGGDGSRAVVEMTLMRIPSTRNIGVLGNRFKSKGEAVHEHEHERLRALLSLVRRECDNAGGLKAAADAWMARTRRLQAGPGRGKVNLGRDKSTGVVDG